MSQTIKAVQIHQYGDADRLSYEDIPKPEPQAGEVLIRVHAASVNPVDWKTRAGQGIARLLTDPFPLILGWDVSGVVEALGAGVTTFAVGDEVYGLIRFPQVGAAYAEYVTAPADHVTHKPTTLDHVQAAALPLVALTAWQSLFDAADLQAGQCVLIHAAAGGVGHIAVQLARWKGAYVIGTASGHNADFLQNLGVDEVINYQEQRFEDRVRDVDVVLDSVDPETQERSWQILKKDGILVSIRGTPSAATATAHGVRAYGVFVQPNPVQLAEITQLVDVGYVKPVIDSIFPLAEARRAHERGQQGHNRGKIVLQVVQ